MADTLGVALLRQIVGLAIAETLDEWGFDEHLENWSALVPAGPELTLSDDQAWRGFLGSIIAKVNRRIRPCRTGQRDSFVAFQTETLRDLRHAIIESVRCS